MTKHKNIKIRTQKYFYCEYLVILALSTGILWKLPKIWNNFMIAELHFIVCIFFWFSDFHSTFYYLIHIPKFALLSNQQTNPSNCQLILFQHEIDLIKSPTMRNTKTKTREIGKKDPYFSVNITDLLLFEWDVTVSFHFISKMG